MARTNSPVRHFLASPSDVEYACGLDRRDYDLRTNKRDITTCFRCLQALVKKDKEKAQDGEG